MRTTRKHYKYNPVQIGSTPKENDFTPNNLAPPLSTNQLPKSQKKTKPFLIPKTKRTPKTRKAPKNQRTRTPTLTTTPPPSPIVQTQSAPKISSAAETASTTSTSTEDCYDDDTEQPEEGEEGEGEWRYVRQIRLSYDSPAEYTEWTKRTRLLDMRRDNQDISDSRRMIYFVFAIISHSLWGTLPGLYRYTQLNTNLDAFLTLSTINFSNFIILGIPLLLVYGLRTMLTIHNIWTAIVLSLGFNFAVAYATKYALSIHVQIILVGAPFVTFIENRLCKLMRLPRFTVFVIFCSAFGCFVALFGQLILVEELHYTTENYVGLGIAALGTIIIGTLRVYHDSLKEITPFPIVIWQSYFLTTIFTLPLALFLRDWQIILEFDRYQAAALGTLGLGVMMVAPFLDFYAVLNIAPTIVDSLYPWRLVVALVLGYSPLLNETMEMVNIVGCGIVMFILGIYLVVAHQTAKHNFESRQQLEL